MKIGNDTPPIAACLHRDPMSSDYLRKTTVTAYQQRTVEAIGSRRHETANQKEGNRTIANSFWAVSAPSRLSAGDNWWRNELDVLTGELQTHPTALLTEMTNSHYHEWQ